MEKDKSQKWASKTRAHKWDALLVGCSLGMGLLSLYWGLSIAATIPPRVHFASVFTGVFAGAALMIGILAVFVSAIVLIIDRGRVALGIVTISNCLGWIWLIANVRHQSLDALSGSFTVSSRWRWEYSLATGAMLGLVISVVAIAMIKGYKRSRPEYGA